MKPAMLNALHVTFFSMDRALRSPVDMQRPAPVARHSRRVEIKNMGPMVAHCLPERLRAITGLQNPSIEKIGRCWLDLTINHADGKRVTEDLQKAFLEAGPTGLPRLSPEQTARIDELIAHAPHRDYNAGLVPRPVLRKGARG